MSVPHQISKSGITFSRNMAIIEGLIGAGLLTTMGSAALLPIILCVISVCYFLGAKTYNKNQLAAAVRADELEAKRDDPLASLSAPEAPIVHKTIYDCTNYDQASFEFTLAKEGVIKLDDVTLCEDAKPKNFGDESMCLLCGPELTRRARAFREAREAAEAKAVLDNKRAVEKARKDRERTAHKRDDNMLSKMDEVDRLRVERYQEEALKWNFGDVKVDQLLNNARISTKTGPKVATMQKCAKCKVYTFFEHRCPKCILVKMKEDDVLAEAKRKEQERRDYERGRMINFNGIGIVRPAEVPDYAEYEFDESGVLRNGIAYVVWKWLKDGKIVYGRQSFVADRYEMHSDTSHEPVSSWVAIYDPKTGDYLGDYKDGETRGPQKPNGTGRTFESQKNYVKELNRKLDKYDLEYKR